MYMQAVFSPPLQPSHLDGSTNVGITYPPTLKVFQVNFDRMGSHSGRPSAVLIGVTTLGNSAQVVRLCI